MNRLETLSENSNSVESVPEYDVLSKLLFLQFPLLLTQGGGEKYHCYFLAPVSLGITEVFRISSPLSLSAMRIQPRCVNFTVLEGQKMVEIGFEAKTRSQISGLSPCPLYSCMDS